MTDLDIKGNEPEVDSPEIENKEEVKEVTISPEELEALKAKAEKFDKKEGDFELAFKKEKAKNASGDKNKNIDFDPEEFKANLKKELVEENFLKNYHVDDAKVVKQSASILGVSLEEAAKNDIVKEKLVANAQDRANKASEDDVSLNGVFSGGEFLGDDDFKEQYIKKTIPQSKENDERYIKVSGLKL